MQQNATRPIGLGVIAAVEGTNNFRDSYSQVLGVAVSRTLGGVGALYVEPIWVNNSRIQGSRRGGVGEDDTFMIGVGTRIRARPTVYLVGEIIPRVAGFDPGVTHASFGIEKRSGGHAFQIISPTASARRWGSLPAAASRTPIGSLGLTFRGNSSNATTSTLDRIRGAGRRADAGGLWRGQRLRRRYAEFAVANADANAMPTPTPGAGRTITITASGVSPRTLTVEAGSRVTFVNNASRAHEMNSDPHPSHTDCPELNQVGFLLAGQSRQTGNLNTARTCGFHDHGRSTDTSPAGHDRHPVARARPAAGGPHASGRRSSRRIHREPVAGRPSRRTIVNYTIQ